MVQKYLTRFFFAVCALFSSALLVSAESVSNPEKSRKILDYFTYSYQGRRPTMEDAHYNCLGVGPDGRYAFFGLYDGHGGDYIAKYAARCLHSTIFNYCLTGPVRQSIIDGTVEAHERARFAESTGSTVLIAIKHGAKLWIGWAGDSRAVIGHADGSFTALTSDHKPNRPDEKERIQSLGGYVSNGDVPRVNGILAVSRALGDKNLNPFVSPVPEVTEYLLTDYDQFLILACDGVWDVLSNQEAVRRVRKSLKLVQDNAILAAKEVVMSAFAAGSEDNITATVVLFE